MMLSNNNYFLGALIFAKKRKLGFSESIFTLETQFMYLRQTEILRILRVLVVEKDGDSEPVEKWLLIRDFEDA